MTSFAHDTANGIAEHAGHVYSIRAQPWSPHDREYSNTCSWYDTSNQCTALLLLQNVKSQRTFKRVLSRLLSDDPASPGADNLVQRLTERIMNPRVGGGPQAMKVFKMYRGTMGGGGVGGGRVNNCS